MCDTALVQTYTKKRKLSLFTSFICVYLFYVTEPSNFNTTTFNTANTIWASKCDYVNTT